MYLKNVFKLVMWLLDILGVNALCRVVNRDKSVIIMYHGICDDGFDLLKGYDERHIPRSLFKKQLKYLKQKGYKFLTMTELLEAIKGKRSIAKSIVLTFDDGFQNVVDNAYPLMLEYGAKGCFYLVSGLVGTDRLVWTDFVETVIRNYQGDNLQFHYKEKTINYPLQDKESREHAMVDIKARLRAIPDKERLEHLEQFSNITLSDIPHEFYMVGWEQVKELDPAVLEIGSHTRGHPNCANLTSDNELEDELLLARTDIENNTGFNIAHFCYPAGSYNDRVVAAVKKSGYTTAVTTDHGFNSENPDPYRLKRIAASGSFTLFKASVSGSYGFFRRIKSMVRGAR